MFEVSNALRNAVHDKDILAARSAIVTYLELDPFNYRKNVDAAIEYALKNGVDVFESHDDKIAMDMDRSHWTFEYIPHIAMTLLRNFSHERINYWKKVAEVAGPQYEKEHPQTPSPANDSPTGMGKNPESHPNVDPAMIAIGVAATVIVIAGVIILLSLS